MRLTIADIVLTLSAFQAITGSPLSPPRVPGPAPPTVSPSTTTPIHAPMEVFLGARHDSVHKLSRRQFCGKLAEVCDLFCVWTALIGGRGCSQYADDKKEDAENDEQARKEQEEEEEKKKQKEKEKKLKQDGVSWDYIAPTNAWGGGDSGKPVPTPDNACRIPGRSNDCELKAIIA